MRSSLREKSANFAEHLTCTTSMALGSCAMKGRVINLVRPSLYFEKVRGRIRADVRSEERVTRPRGKVQELSVEKRSAPPCRVAMTDVQEGIQVFQSVHYRRARDGPSSFRL